MGAYASHIANIENAEETRRAALTRLFDYYLAAAAVAADTLKLFGNGRLDPVEG